MFVFKILSKKSDVIKQNKKAGITDEMGERYLNEGSKGGCLKDVGKDGVRERENEKTSVAASILVIYSLNVLAPFA